MQWDLPKAAQRLESALALARRHGNRYWESVSSSNLMHVYLLAGRWEELERLAADLLECNEKRPGSEELHYRLALLHALRGELDAARASLERLTAWKNTDDRERQAMHSSVTISVCLAEGQAQAALERGQKMLGPMTETLASGHAWRTVSLCVGLLRSPLGGRYPPTRASGRWLPVTRKRRVRMDCSRARFAVCLGIPRWKCPGCGAPLPATNTTVAESSDVAAVAARPARNRVDVRSRYARERACRSVGSADRAELRAGSGQRPTSRCCPSRSAAGRSQLAG
jgi:hypothetical protein